MKKYSEISRMFKYARNRHWLTVAGMILAGNIKLAVNSGTYA